MVNFDASAVSDRLGFHLCRCLAQFALIATIDKENHVLVNSAPS